MQEISPVDLRSPTVIWRTLGTHQRWANMCPTPLLPHSYTRRELCTWVTINTGGRRTHVHHSDATILLWEQDNKYTLLATLSFTRVDEHSERSDIFSLCTYSYFLILLILSICISLFRGRGPFLSCKLATCWYLSGLPLQLFLAWEDGVLFIRFLWTRLRSDLRSVPAPPSSPLVRSDQITPNPSKTPFLFNFARIDSRVLSNI